MGPRDEVIAKTTASNSFTFSSLNHSSFFQIKLFYVRISSCLIDSVPNHLTLRHRQIRLSPDINGSHSTAASDAPPLTLRRDRVDRDSAEVTYVTTDTVCVTGSLEFEVYEKEGMLLFLCGSLERLEGDNGIAGSSLGWEIECHVVADSIGSGSLGFIRPKLGALAPSIEVYVAGCCSGVPVILSKTIWMSSRRRVSRHVTLDAIPEDEEMMMMMRTEKEHEVVNGMITHGKLKVTGSEDDDYVSDDKMRHGFYTQEMYAGEDGQLTWFNAGVRVGVGIGLGMCLGIGVGVGLLMRSYQTTTRNLKRRFF